MSYMKTLWFTSFKGAKKWHMETVLFTTSDIKKTIILHSWSTSCQEFTWVLYYPKLFPINKKFFTESDYDIISIISLQLFFILYIYLILFIVVKQKISTLCFLWIKKNFSPRASGLLKSFTVFDIFFMEIYHVHSRRAYAQFYWNYSLGTY